MRKRLQSDVRNVSNDQTFSNSADCMALRCVCVSHSVWHVSECVCVCVSALHPDDGCTSVRHGDGQKLTALLSSKQDFSY